MNFEGIYLQEGNDYNAEVGKDQYLVDECPVVFCVDSNYLPYLRPLVYSLESLTQGNFDIYIIVPPGTDINESHKQLSNIFPNGLHYIEFDIQNFSEVLNNSNHIPISTYLRLFIPKILPPSIKYSLYLDTDLLILGDLSPLLTSKPNEPFSVVPARGTLSHHPLLTNLTDFFYGGVMLLNHQEWLRQDITTKCIEMARSHGPFQNQDNDLLHLIFEEGKSWGKLAPEFNTMFYETSIFSRWKKEPVIVHFPGSEKPWNSFTGGYYAYEWRRLYKKLEPQFRLPRVAFFRFLEKCLIDLLYKSLLKPIILLRSEIKSRC